MLIDQSHKTAISRNKPSAPIRAIDDILYLRESILPMLDYGCGRGFDADWFGMDKYDPYYFPELDRSKKYNRVFCTYVLNVVNLKTEYEILVDINSLLAERGVGYISVRRDMGLNGRRLNGYDQRYSYPISNPFVMEDKLLSKNLRGYMHYKGRWETYRLARFEPMSTQE